jgi:hypothetical protein
MLTFQDQYQLFQQITGDFTPAGLALAKRDINEGCALFLNRLGRKFNKEYLTASTVASQQYYQFPSEVLRISEIRILQGNNYYTPILVTSEAEWNALNTILTKGNYPSHYYIRGFNEVGLFPMPSTAIANALVISYEPQHVDLTQDDFTTGTLTVNNGQVAVTNSQAVFTQNMVGRWLQVNDGTDGKWYRVGAFISATVLNLENFYEGISGAGHTFRIGEIAKIPNAYQDAPVYFACERFYMTQNDQRTAPIFATRFETKVRSAKETYAHSTSRMGVKSSHRNRRPTWLELTRPVIYP